jgi:hypothetical protein
MMTPGDASKPIIRLEDGRDHIQINRSFTRLPTKRDQVRGEAGSLGWTDLHDLEVIVIVAPEKAGKTAELMARANAASLLRAILCSRRRSVV